MIPSTEEKQGIRGDTGNGRPRFGLSLFALLLGILIVMVAGRVGTAGAARDPGPDPFFGIITQTPLAAADFDTMAWGRLGSYRATINWKSVDRHGDGNMDWSRFDNLVEATAKRGIALLPVFYNTPSWLARDRRRLPVWNGYARYQWKYFLRAAVARYGTDGTFWAEHPDVPELPVRNWQIWNEPNIKFWAWPISPRRYARLIKISARAIRNTDPKAKIVTAGFYARPRNGTGITSRRYLKRLYRVRGFRRSFDIAAIHPYATSTRKSVRRTFPIRKVMNRNGQRRKRIMVTELGWGSDAATSFGTGSRDAQAVQLTSAYRAYLRHRRQLHLKAVFWFSWADLPADMTSCSFCSETGLFDTEGKAKPAWHRLLDFTQDL